MKGALNVIRWKFVLPVGILLAAVILFFVLFFDPIAERAIERVASKVNGAKVEVDGLKTKFFQGRVDISRLQVTDREQPMRNVIETAGMSFQLNPFEAARMRFVINESAIHGVQFNTARKSSGAMPRLAKKADESAEPGPAEKLAKKYAGRFQLSLAGMKNEAKKKIEFDPKETEVYKRSQELQERGKKMPSDWQARVDNLKAEERLKKIQSDIDSIKATPTSGPQAVTEIPKALKKLNETRAELTQLQSDVKGTRDSIGGDIRSFRTNILSLNEAKKQDVDNLMSRLNLDFADPQRLMESVIGPVVLERYRTVLKYVQIARKHMPAKKDKEEIQQHPRANGTNIEFPTPAAPPRFWLQHAALDGKYQAVTAAGQMTDLTTDPARAGKPFKLALDGASGAQRYLLQAVLDHVTDVPRDSFVMKATGIDLASISPTGAALLQGGGAAAEIALSVMGEGNLGGGVNLGLTGVKIDRATFFKTLDVPEGDKLSADDKLKSTFANNLASAVEALPQVSVSAQIYGTWDDPGLKISSNLTDTFAGVVKSSIGNFVKDQRAELEGKLDAVTAEEKKKLEAQAGQLEAQMGDRLKKIEEDVNAKVSQASGINLGGGESKSPVKVPNLKKIFR